MADVGGVANLRHLAVTDDIDSGFTLPADRIRNSAPDGGVEIRGIVAVASILCKQQIGHFLGARQAAYMRSENALGASFHQSSLLASCAPATRLSNLAHITVGCTRSMDSACANPQSVPAITFSRP